MRPGARSGTAMSSSPGGRNWTPTELDKLDPRFLQNRLNECHIVTPPVGDLRHALEFLDIGGCLNPCAAPSPERSNPVGYGPL